MKIGVAEIGDAVLYNDRRMYITGYFDKLCDSSSPDMVILYPTDRAKGKYLRLHSNGSQEGFIKPVRLTKLAVEGIDAKVLIKYKAAHNRLVASYRRYSTKDEPAIADCFKVKLI